MFQLLPWVSVQGSYFKLSRLIFSSQDSVKAVRKKEGDSVGDGDSFPRSRAEVRAPRTFSQGQQPVLLQNQ